VKPNQIGVLGATEECGCRIIHYPEDAQCAGTWLCVTRISLENEVVLVTPVVFSSSDQRDIFDAMVGFLSSKDAFSTLWRGKKPQEGEGTEGLELGLEVFCYGPLAPDLDEAGRKQLVLMTTNGFYNKLLEAGIRVGYRPGFNRRPKSSSDPAWDLSQEIFEDLSKRLSGAMGSSLFSTEEASPLSDVPGS